MAPLVPWNTAWKCAMEGCNGSVQWKLWDRQNKSVMTIIRTVAASGGCGQGLTGKGALPAGDGKFPVLMRRGLQESACVKTQ